MFARCLAVLLTVASLVLAQVQVTSPTGGTIANSALSVQLSGATGMTVVVQVVVGGAKADGSDSTVVYTLPSSGAYQGGTIAGTVPTGAGPNAAFAAYYLKVIATPASGGPSTAYSSRFALTGMTGGWASTTIQQAAQAAAAANQVPANAAGAAAGAGAGGSAAPSGTNIPFSLQTGAIKYAPMQLRPGTAITAQNTAPLYPTSAWSIFTTLAPTPFQTSTVTPSATYSTSSRENTAAPAAMPSDDMAKFLARWKD